MKRFFQSKGGKAYIAFWGVFLLLLYSSSYIVLSIEGLYAQEVDSVSAPRENSLVFKDLYYITVSNNVDGEVEIAGYAYMETALPNADKKIDIYLVSEQRTYLIPTELSVRHDLSAERTGKMIQGMNHSFSGKTSYLPLADGIYQLVLYCYENEQTAGYVNLNRYYEKKGNLFQESAISSVDVISEQISERNGTDLTNVDIIPSDPVPWHYIRMQSQDGTYFSFTGWIANISLDSRNSRAFLAFTDQDNRTKVYTTTAYESKSVESAVGSTLANHGFFDAAIPFSDFEPGTYTLNVLTQYPEGIWKPQISYSVEIQISGVTLTAAMSQST